ncbi:MAG: hypothetical protein ACRC0G_07230 [Fusobacteriaceae bacterium]
MGKNKLNLGQKPDIDAMGGVLEYFTSILSNFDFTKHLGKLVIFVQGYSSKDVTRENLLKLLTHGVGLNVPVGTPMLPRKNDMTDAQYVDHIMNVSVGVLKDYDLAVSVVDSLIIPDENSKVDFVVVDVTGGGLVVSEKPRLLFDNKEELMHTIAQRYVSTINEVFNGINEGFIEVSSDQEDCRDLNEAYAYVLRTLLEIAPHDTQSYQYLTVDYLVKKFYKIPEDTHTYNLKSCFKLFMDIEYIESSLIIEGMGCYDEDDYMSTLNCTRNKLGLREYIKDVDYNFILCEEFSKVGFTDLVCTSPETKDMVIRDIIFSTSSNINIVDMTLGENFNVVNRSKSGDDRTIFVDTIMADQLLLNTISVHLACKDIQTGEPLYNKISRY